MKIVLVGTFPPFRGGISNFYHTMADRLSIDYDVHAINFTTQYPDLLFPGKSQFSETAAPISYNTERILSSVNPISWRKTAKRIIELQPDLIIFKYWMPFFAPVFASVLKKVKKNLDVNAMVVCDNIIPHEGRPMDTALTRKFFDQVDHFVVMSKSVEEDLLSLYPKANYAYSPHPLYDLFGTEIEQRSARSEIGVSEDKLLLYFGLIRPYKGLDILIKSAKILKEKISNFKILAVGDCYDDPQIYHDLIKENDVDDVFDLRTEFVPDHKVSSYFSAADVVVLPYKDATQSGVVPVAYHFNTPVVVSDVGGLKEIVENDKTGYVVQPNKENIAQGIIKYYNNKDSIDFPEEIEKYKSRFSWEEFLNKMLSLVQ